MPELPTGTVTFLFTDIEGSTRLWQDHPAAARGALARHDALVEQLVAEHDGVVVRPRGEGDSRFAVFARATDAVAAAAALQQALSAEPWPAPTPLRVRMALHTGEADLRDGDYYGTAVNRCARLRAVAHGAQTLLSTATQELVRDSLPSGVTLHDLGEHRLKDLTRPERIFQLVAASLPAAFPPLKSMDLRPHNLPIQRDPLLGREREVAEVVSLLRRPEVALVTLTGPGGTGKTRLSQQVAAEMLDEYADGAWFVDLAPLSDPALVLSTIAQTLGLKETGDQPIAEMLAAYLRTKHLLLVLDNFEQVIPAAPALTTLLRATAGLKVLITSRELLHLSGEQDYPVPPLALPNLHQRESLERLTQYAAVALFIQRAQAGKPDFHVTNANAPAVAEICVRLDGLPLAIELAAARVRLLPPETLLKRLDNRLKLLTGGVRDQAARQQTLRAAIDWSYHLLSEPEQQLFTRLAVFVGGWTLEAAEMVCLRDVDDEIDILDGLQSLLDKSLLHQERLDGGEPRFTMLETLREYAVERLEASGDAEQIRQQHATYFQMFSQRPEPDPSGTTGWHKLDLLTAEHDNIRAALNWAIKQQNTMIAVTIAACLKDFWWFRGHWREGRSFVEAVLPLSAGVDPMLQSRVWDSAGQMASLLGDRAAATHAFEQALIHAREAGNQGAVAFFLNALAGDAAQAGEIDRAFALNEESISLSRQIDDKSILAIALNDRGGMYILLSSDYSRAETYLQDSLALSRDLGFGMLVGVSLSNLGLIARLQGEYAQAQSYAQDYLAMAQEMGSPLHTSDAWMLLGRVKLDQGDADSARSLYQDALKLAKTLGERNIIVECIDGVARLAAAPGWKDYDAVRAARLGGAATTFRDRTQPWLVEDRQTFDLAMTAASATIGATVFDAAWAEGQQMTLDQSVAYALGESDDA